MPLEDVPWGEEDRTDCETKASVGDGSSSSISSSRSGGRKMENPKSWEQGALFLPRKQKRGPP